MAVEWTKDLSVGVDLIDKQHQTWFSKANDLFEAGMQGKSKEKISQTLEFLDAYTKTHFQDEEKYMREIGYPEYETQRKLHATFIEELAKLKTQFEASGGNVVVIISANQMVVSWLTKHISSMDKKIGEYAKKIGK